MSSFTMYNQSKLTRSEWNSIEIPLPQKEVDILKTIQLGFKDVNIRNNTCKSLCSYLKIENSDEMDKYLFNEYFYPLLIIPSDLNVRKFNSKVNITKADKIRISKIKGDDIKHIVFEFILIDYVKNCVKSFNSKYNTYSIKKKHWYYYYYSVNELIKLRIEKINKYVLKIINDVLNYYKEHINLVDIVLNSDEIIENNLDLLKYEDLKLYDHQKRIFTVFKTNVNPKLVLYSAPTGTGKTLTPIGLSEKYKIIFVCAARHVGLALARSAINIHKKTAFAFGCNSSGDVKLHYFSAKEYEVNKRTGTIFRIDNTIGDKVEILICDVKSYLHAMNYMCAFNDPNNILTYWDEPTISLDYETHDLHQIIKKNWDENIIPNVVLSSATLPKEHEIQDVLANFKHKFENSEIETITSYDCKKTIPIVRSNGYNYVPHSYEDYDEVKNISRNCTENPSLLRYINFKEILNVLKIIESNPNFLKSNKYRIENIFESINDITIKHVKEHYLNVLQNIHSVMWGPLYLSWISDYRKKNEDYTPYITTHSSYTLKNGPTIYISNDVHKISAFCIQELNIPEKELNELMVKIDNNSKIVSEIQKLEKDLECIAESSLKTNNTNCGSNKKTSKIIQEKMSNDKNPQIRRIQENIDILKKSIQTMSLNNVHIPNRQTHISRWASNKNTEHAYTSDISEDIVESIMKLDVRNSWKLLLLLGIGVFTDHDNIEYTEIMKGLADSQKLYLIIADSDYIYGTNYQFCHGYIGKDLNISQEKIIQAMGRIGRNNIQHTYSIRFRDDRHIDVLFRSSDQNKIEVVNMNKLWGIT